MASIPYRKWPKGKKPIASLVLALLIGSFSTAQMHIEDVAESEGYVPYGYKDPVGIPTKCFGDTTNVVLGKEYSWDECVQSLNTHLVETSLPVVKCLGDVWGDMPEETRAAVLSLSYNIGPGAFCKSSVAKFFKAGNFERACRRIGDGTFYVTAKGKKFQGLVNRRDRESKMCLRGLEKKNAGMDN